MTSVHPRTLHQMLTSQNVLQFAPNDLDPNGLKYVQCSLAHGEFITNLTMKSDSSSNYQKIKAMRWKTNKGNYCVVPSKYQPTDSVFQHGTNVGVGSGIPYGIVLSKVNPMKITSMGIVFYDIVTSMENEISWQEDVAKLSLKKNPDIAARVNCNSDPDSLRGRCSLSFTYTMVNTQSIQSTLFYAIINKRIHHQL